MKMADLGKIIQKLSHPVSEVRVRSLENIISKIVNGIINVEELIHIHELFVSLTDWLTVTLNQQLSDHHHIDKDVSNPIYLVEKTTRDILSVLLAVSKYAVAKEKLIDLGCICILSSFKSHTVFIGLKGMIDEILHNLIQHHSYKHFLGSDIDGSSSFLLLANANESIPRKQVSILNDYRSFQDFSNLTPEQGSIAQGLNENHASQKVPQVMPYKDSVAVKTDNIIFSISGRNISSPFPWISLTSGDRDILSVTNRRLQSQSSDMIKQSCQFLQFVLFNDFPIEVFIQRPKIFFTLLTIIKCKKDSEILGCVSLCLIEFTKKLYKRLHKSEIGETQSDDIDDELESNLTKDNFQKEQLSILDFSWNIFDNIVSLFKIYDSDDFLFSQLSLLFFLNIKLLPHQYLENCGEKLNSRFKTTIEELVDNILVIPLQRCEIREDRSQDKCGLEVKAIIMAKILLYMILKSVPDEKLPDVTSIKIIEFYQKLICNPSVKSLHVFLKKIEHFLRFTDKAFLCDLVKAKSLVFSMKSIDKCIFYFTETDTGVPEMDQILDFKCAFKSLPYHCHKYFIDATIKLCCQKFLPGKQESEKWYDLMNCLLQSISEDIDVAKEILTGYLNTLKSALSDSLVVNPLSRKHQLAELLIQKDILSKVVFLSSCQSLKIIEITRNIISTLLLSRLCMSAQMWHSTLSSIISVFPFLVVMLTETTNSIYETSLYSILEHHDVWKDIDGNGFETIDTDCFAKILFQMLFSKCSSIRKKIIQIVLLKFVERDKTFDLTSPSFNDILIFTENQLELLSDSKSKSYEFTDKSAEKLWEILIDDTRIYEIRCSAAEQLSLLTDYSQFKLSTLHCYYRFITHEVTSFIRNYELACNEQYYVKLILVILKNMVACQLSINTFFLQSSFLFDLFYGAIIFFKEEGIRYEISCSMAYIVFSDLLQLEGGKIQKFSLPRIIFQSFNFPFQLSCANESCHLKTTLLDGTLREYVKMACWKECTWYRDVNVEIDCSKNLLISNQACIVDVYDLIEMIRNHLTLPASLYDVINQVGQLQLLIFLIDVEEISESSLSKHIISFLDNLFSTRLFNMLFLHLSASHSNQLSLVMSQFWLNIIDTDLKPLIKHFDKSSLVDYMVLMNNLKIPASPCKDSLLWQQKTYQCLSSFLEFDTCLSTYQSGFYIASFEGISKLVLTLNQRLSLTRTESYYDLPFLEVVLECFMHLSVYKKWSASCGDKLSAQIFHWLNQIIISFHSDQSIASVSFMGKGVVKKAIICMCHIFYEIKCSFNENIKRLFIQHNDDTEDSNLNLVWLTPLLSDRLIDVRWGALALSSVLLMENDIHNLCVSEYQHLPGGIWAANIQIILNRKECVLIRTQASILLSHLMKTSKHTWNQMVVQEIDTKVKLYGLNGFLKLLTYLDFFSHIQDIFLILSKSVFCIDISYQNLKSDHPDTKRVELLNLNFYCSLLDLVLQMMILSPDLVDDPSFFEVLETMFHQWSPERLLHLTKKTRFCKIESEVFQRQVRITLLITQMINVIYQQKRTNVLDSFCKHSLTEKLLTLFQLHLTPNSDSIHLYILIWKNCLKVLLFDELIQNVVFKEKIFGILHSICRCCLLISGCKRAINPIFNKFFRIIFLVLKWATFNYEKEKALVSKLSLEEKTDILEMIFRDEGVMFNDLSDNSLLGLMLIFLRRKVGCANYFTSTLALSYIFVLDETTKDVAYKYGLPNLLLEEIQCLSANQMTTWKLRCKFVDSQNFTHHHISCLLILIRNFCAFSSVAKKALVDLNLIYYLKEIWLWKSLDSYLRKVLLQLLIVLSNNCNTALIKISENPKKYEEHSLALLITRYVMKAHGEIDFIKGKISPCLVLAFDLLGNLVHDSVSRSIFIKSKLLTLFETVFLYTNCTNNVQKSLMKTILNIWLKFISILTFYEDGSKSMAKVLDLYRVLTHVLMTSGSLCQKERSLIIFRNLMFVPIFRQITLSDFKSSFLFGILKDKSATITSLVISILWVLMYGSEKKEHILNEMGIQMSYFEDYNASGTKEENSNWLCTSGLESSKMLQKLLLKH